MRLKLELSWYEPAPDEVKGITAFQGTYHLLRAPGIVKVKRTGKDEVEIVYYHPEYTMYFEHIRRDFGNENCDLTTMNSITLW